MVILAIGWHRIYDTVHSQMPYKCWFTMSNISVNVDTVELHPVVSRVCAENKYMYAFNGKPRDDEWAGQGNHYNYGFRLSDPRIARFISVDPLTQKYPWYTPYQFAGNTPIQATDIDGLEPEYMIDKNGKISSPVISALHAGLGLDASALGNTNWVPVDKVNRMNSDAMTVFSKVQYNNNLNYSDRSWFELIAHEGTHRTELGNSVLGELMWYTGYGMGWVGAGFSYSQNSYEKRAYANGFGGNRALAKQLFAFDNGAIGKILLDNSLSQDQKVLKAGIVGWRFRIETLQQRLSQAEQLYSTLPDEDKAKILNPIKWEIDKANNQIEKLNNQLKNYENASNNKTPNAGN